jgi:predicted RNA-binding Zn ribbon-like protein
VADVQTAPGELELVRRFVNTNDIDEGIDEIATADKLRDWLTHHDLEVGNQKLSGADVARTVELREALRQLLLANAGEELSAAAVRRLNAAAAEVKLALHFERDGGSALAPEAAGLDGALGAILAIVYRSMAEGTWERLKACRADDCQWGFYDTSRNRSAHWCSMAVCGNRAKARTYRQKHK